MIKFIMVFLNIELETGEESRKEVWLILAKFGLNFNQYIFCMKIEWHYSFLKNYICFGLYTVSVKKRRRLSSCRFRDQHNQR